MMNFNTQYIIDILRNNNIIVYTIICVLSFQLLFVFISRRKIRKVKRLAKKKEAIRIDNYLRAQHPLSEDFAGIYILHNRRNGKNYIGQGRRVNKRAQQHFSDHGSPGVYRDYKKGHLFTIKIIPLRRSGMKDLNELERVAIKAFHGYTRGYNRTRGNNPKRKKRKNNFYRI